MTDPVVNSIISKRPDGTVRLVVMRDGLVHDIYEADDERQILKMHLELLVKAGIIEPNWMIRKKELNRPK